MGIPYYWHLDGHWWSEGYLWIPGDTAEVLPFIANILGWGVGVICTVVGVVWSLIVIAIAWLFYRPLLGITLLVVAGLLIWIFAFKGKDKLKELAAKSKKKEVVTA